MLVKYTDEEIQHLQQHQVPQKAAEHCHTFNNVDIQRAR